MKRICLSVVVACATFSFVVASQSTNVVACATSLAAVTNAPTAKLTRTRCEAVTKSGTRCKRNAAPGEKLCRQHLKIVRQAK